MAKNIIWLYPKLDKWMGGTKFVFECTKRLSKEHVLRVVAQKGSVEVISKFREEGIEVTILNSRTFTDLSFWFLFAKIIKSNKRVASDYIGSDTTIISSMYPMNYLASTFSNKHVQIIYEPFSFFYRNDLYKDLGIAKDLFFRFIRLIYAWSDKLATKRANIVLTLSQYEKNKIKEIYGVNSDVIYEGVDTAFFYPRDTKDLKAKNDGRLPLMHSTGFDQYKGTDLIFEALPALKLRLPNFKLFITYTREEKRKLDIYKRIISRNGLEKNVEFLQFLPLEELPYYYSFARIYLEPGKGRSMSLSNKEAMACGTPVIRGNDSGEEVIDGYNGFQVSTDNPKELIEAIINIVTNDELRNRMSANAVSSVKDKFSWNSVVNKIGNYL
jgi:glycosyltransferase involved in cell wall biosynthesis